MPTLDLKPFKDLVNQRCGLNFDDVAAANLITALAKRMAVTGNDTAAGYFTRIVSDEHEFQELVELLTVNETYFFREPAQLTFLVESLVPRLMAKRAGNQRIRILSAGCSTGEEPYSIAIALKEKFGESVGHLVSITGVDIDQRALDKARKAEYGEFSFRALSTNLRDRHFARKDTHSYLLGTSVRTLVEFHHLNLLSSAYPEHLRGFDIVFFRNVSIYFDAITRKAILSNLRTTMNEEGILVVGASETLANDLGILHPVDEDGRFYFVNRRTPSQPAAFEQERHQHPVGNNLAATLATPPRPKRPPLRPQDASSAPHTTTPQTPVIDLASTLTAVRLLAREKKYPETLQALHPLRIAFPTDIHLLLLEGHVRLQMRQFSEAAAIASLISDQDPWSADAHMLLALAAKWQGDVEHAIHGLRMVIYSKPDCWPAHYYLGTLLQETDAIMARRAYATALRQITMSPDPDGGLWLPLDLPVADIRFLCERHNAVPDSGRAKEPTGDRR